jgi:hypothetical protein
VRDQPYVLYHRLSDPASAAIRAKIVEAGLKPLVDFQNVDTDGADAFAAHGGVEVPALWDGRRLHQGSYAVRLALGAIIAAEGQGER